MIQKILKSGDPVLRKLSKPIAKIDAKIQQIIQDLKDTLAVQKDPEGVALAAPQIGKSWRIFVVDYQNLKCVVINPEILEIRNQKSRLPDGQAQVKNKLLEGCLSLPGYYSPLKRASWVKIKYLNENGEEKTEVFQNFDTQIVLHEIDHLDGILFLDRLLEKKKPLYKVTNKDEWEEVEL